MADDSVLKTGSTASRWWPWVKWSLFILMLYFVGHRAVGLWQSSPTIELHVDIRWLVPAAIFYLVGWLPSVWFWRALLSRMHQKPAWYATIRAYFVGHMGKYVPGKALVLVIRGALLKDYGAKPVLAGLTAAYETLVSMSAGAAIAIALAPTVIPESLWEKLPTACHFLRQQPFMLPIAVVIATFASTPFSAWLFTKVGRKAIPRTTETDVLTNISGRLVSQGVIITSLGWICHALSLGCVLQSISDSPIDFSLFPVWLASVAGSTFLGFVVLIAPGGLGVREWVLIEIMKDQPSIGTERAIVAAGLLRIVWFVAELGAAAVLYSIWPGTRRNGGSSPVE